LVGNNITGQYDTKTAISTSNKYIGWFFDFYSYSNNLSININSVELYTETSVESSIKIYNASTGDLLETITFQSSANTINRIFINKEFPIWKYPHIFIAYDANVIQTIEADDLFIGQYDFISQREVGTGTSPKKDNLDGAQSNGLIVNYNLNCSIDNFVCHRRDFFKESYWYLLGVEFCNERLHSDRINRYTLLNREQAVELRDQFDAEYKMKINAMIKGLKMDYDDDCFVCNKAVNYRMLIP
jgi:hypothetical protein